MNCRNCGQALDDASRFCKFCGAAVPPDPDEAAAPIKIGDLLEGKWKIEKKIGQGGMGSVYIAQDVSLERKVAIKILAPDLCNDREFVVRFEREAKATANLEHPNVVLVYSVGQHFGRPFIVMKYLEGQSLARHLRQHPGGLPLDEVVRIFKQLCSGLGFIHQKGLVHRDIKTGNIFIGPDGKATILDFGILRDTRQKENLTRVGVVMGTPHYLAPEQAIGKKIDHRADLYAVGVLLYECLVGTPPFNAENAKRLIEMHMRQAPPDPCRVMPDLPPAVGEVVKKALAKKPEGRFQTAEELAQALEAACVAAEPELEPHEEPEPEPERPPAPTKAKPRTPTRGAVRAVEPPASPEAGARPRTPTRGAIRAAEPPAPAAEPAAPAPKKSALLPIALLLALLGIGAVAWSFLQKQPEESAKAPPSAEPLEPDPELLPPPKPKPPDAKKELTSQEQAKALLEEGRELARGKHFDFAIGKFMQAEELAPEDPELILALAETYRQVGEVDNAVKYYGKALARNPGDMQLRLGVVRTYAKADKPKDAARELRTAVEAGFTDFATLEADEELAALRKEPGYREAKRIAEGGSSDPAPTVRPREPKGGAPSGSPDDPGDDSAVMGLTGELKVFASSPDSGPASVRIDGKPRGSTPLTLELKAGKHVVTLERDGYKTVTREVKVPLASSFTLTVPLEPK